VVLLGHSLGGVNALVFASKYPDRAAGVVVLDPPPVDFVMGREFTVLRQKANQFTQQFKELAATERKRGNDRQAAFFEAVASEHEALFEGSSRREFEGIKTLGGIPLTVLSSEKPNPQMGESAEDFQRFWIRSNERLSRLSLSGRFVLATNASHHIHLDAPETVIRAVRQIVQQERQRAKAEQ
jgi:pimeloyl-ACP methyl ester carboxylesterase